MDFCHIWHQTPPHVSLSPVSWHSRPHPREPVWGGLSAHTVKHKEKKGRRGQVVSDGDRGVPARSLTHVGLKQEALYAPRESEKHHRSVNQSAAGPRTAHSSGMRTGQAAGPPMAHSSRTQTGWAAGPRMSHSSGHRPDHGLPSCWAPRSGDAAHSPAPMKASVSE